jgi:methylglutaconyl-CoA hydratase
MPFDYRLSIRMQVRIMGENIRLIREESGIARIIISRPEKKNALTREMISDLICHLGNLQWESSDKLRFLVLEGEGDFFCSGADLSTMEDNGKLPREENLQEALTLARLFREIAAVPFPTMAKVKGGALAGAMGLLAATDFVVAEESSLFGTPEVRAGLLPAVVSLYLNRKIGLSRLASMSLLGRLFPASEAFALGIIHHIAPSGFLEKETSKIENDFLCCGPDALRRMKLLLLKISPLPEKEIEEFAAFQIAEARASAEAGEGIAARKEKRAPGWAANEE